MTGPEDQCARLGDAALYVLGTLHGHRLESFVRHLRRCEECAEEVELLQHASEAVPLLGSRLVTPAEEDQPELRAPSLRVAVSNPTRTQRRDRSGDTRRTGGQAHDRPLHRPALRPIPGGAAGSARTPAAAGAGRRLLRTPLPRGGLFAFLALAVLAVVTVALSGQAAGVRYTRIRAGWASGGAALKLQGDHLELLVEGMPLPARGHGYQVWTVDRLSGRRTPTRTWLHLNGRGEAGADVPGDYHDWLAVAVYVEPLHGRDSTRSGAVVVGDLRHQR